MQVEVIESMRVAYIMSRFPKLSETFILREIMELEKQGRKIVLFPLLRLQESVSHPEVARLLPKVQFTPFLSPRILAAHLFYLRHAPRIYLKTLWLALRGNWGSVNLFMGALAIFPKAVYLARRVEEDGIGHVHAHFATHPTLAALIVSELTGIGYSFTAHAHDIFVHTRMLEEKIKRARFVVTVSDSNKQYLLQLCRSVHADKVKIIRCGVELERYCAEPARSSPEKMFTILCVANLERYKGLEYLIEACALFKPRAGRFRCLLAGGGKERGKLQWLIRRLKLTEVQMLGPQSGDNVAALLKEADVFVLPSVVARDGQMEGVPVAIMEAMASGLPVVSTCISGIPELVMDKATGLLVAPRDANALAEAILFLYRNESLRREWGSAGRQRIAAEFQLTSNVKELHSLFESVAAAGLSLQTQREISRRIRDRAPDYFPQVKRNGALAVRFSPKSRGHDSEVYEILLEDGCPDWPKLILKLHRPGRAQPERLLEHGRRYALREHQTLSFLSQKFASLSNRLAVPQPFDCFPQFAALVVEKCEGITLDRRLRWARLWPVPRRLAELYRQVRSCGEWLALFHCITLRETGPGEVYQSIERDFDEHLTACAEAGLDAHLATRIRRRFEEGKSSAFNDRRKVVGRHCDFAPYNIFLSPARTAVIDFEGFQDGIAYQDLCYFLGRIECLPFYHSSGELSLKLKRSFLDGYERQESLDAAVLEFFMLPTMVQIMAHSPLLQERPTSWVHGWKQTNQLHFFKTWFEERMR